jgi:hypothetical protein
MMGKPPPRVPKPRYYGSRLEDRIPSDDLLRKSSMTDPDAAIVPKGSLSPGARYKNHRAAKRDRRRRKWRMEGSLGYAATHYGFGRARWWRLRRQQIQDLLIATVQNLRTLVRYVAAPVREAGVVSASVRILAGAGIATVLGRWASRFACYASSYQLDISDPTPGGSGAEADHLMGTSSADRQAAGGTVLQGNTQAGPEIQPLRPTQEVSCYHAITCGLLWPMQIMWLPYA